MIRNTRSQNLSLSIGAVEGKVRFNRPDSASADEVHAVARAQELHTAHYGSMGISGNSVIRIDDARPDAATREIF